MFITTTTTSISIIIIIIIIITIIITTIIIIIITKDSLLAGVGFALVIRLDAAAMFFPVELVLGPPLFPQAQTPPRPSGWVSSRWVSSVTTRLHAHAHAYTR